MSYKNDNEHICRNESKKISPIIKWAGGKRQLLPVIKSRMPKNFDRYFEPFFGGGALYFEIEPAEAVINDFNDQLVNMYQQIKTNHTSVEKFLDTYQDHYNLCSSLDEKDAYYYLLRDRFNGCIAHSRHTAESAALFIFLNKSGFNGLYRVNKSGKFNVAPGHKASVKAYDRDNLESSAELLKTSSILMGDFEQACAGAVKGDYVFFDSPYFNTFDTYQAGGFSMDDHRRLAGLFAELTDRGVFCMLTNSNTEFIKDLYKGYSIDVVNVKRMINCDGRKRTGTEVIVTNY